MKALIVDDEYHIFKAMQMLIDWDKYGIDELVYAENGKQALEKLTQEKPRLVFTDMQMPEMDGKTFVKELRNRGNKAQIIAVSGYEDFEYTKAVIQAEGVDYILKPLRREELEEAVEKAIAAEEEQEKKSTLHRKVNLMTKEEAELMVTRCLNEKERREHLQGALEILGAKQTDFCTAMILFKNPNAIRQELFGGSQKAMFFVLNNVAQEIFSEDTFCFAAQLDEYSYFLLSQLEENVRERFGRYMRKYRDTLNDVLGIESRMILCEKQVDESELIQEINRQKSRLLDEMVWGKAKLSGTEEKRIINTAQMEHMLKMAVEEGGLESIGRIIDGFVNELRKQDNLTFGELQIYTTQINLTIQRLSVGKEKAYIKEVSPWIFDMKEWSECVKENLYNLASQNKTEGKNIEHVYDYLTQKYMEAVSMTELSEIFNQSPQYLSKQFKKKYGKTIGESLKEIRMKNAKELLKYSKLLVGEIAHTVGFEDENYFCKVFKNCEGMTPLQYRKEQE